MKKTKTVLLMSAMISAVFLAGCGSKNEAVENTSAAETASQERESEAGEADQKAADQAAALIDAIYVQRRTLDTDRQCAEAKAAWDALTDTQKSLVEGEFADPDYFGRDTGDAALDNPRNQNDIGEKEILVVSFGTSFNDSRVSDIKGIEDGIQEANPDWAVRRAFTSQIIINHIQARDGQYIDNMDQAMERAAANGVKHLIIQPTHLMKGTEYDELMETVTENLDRFETIKVAQPLLGDIGEDAAAVNQDKQAVAELLTAEAVKDAGFDSLESAAKDGTAFVFLGHGTSHTAKVSYTQMQSQMAALGYDNVFIGTVEGEPEETSCEALLETVSAAGYKKVVLRPLMVVAGDHANNDMAGEEEDSWLSRFQASGKFEKVTAQIAGLGSIKGIQQLYAAHTEAAIKAVSKQQGTRPEENGQKSKEGTVSQNLKDGVYQAAFHTDSSMFQVNDTLNGMGKLTVKDGEMTIHISLGSKNILNLYLGLAADAAKEDAGVLEPSVDSIVYPDGTAEEVHGFDVPVPVLNQEFDLALIGKKGKWYDHKVSVSNPVPVLEDGVYAMDLTIEGGSGKAEILSPAKVTVKDGQMKAEVRWNSPNYDYMMVAGERYLPVSTDGNSVFQIPVTILDQPFSVIGNTVAMSKPHEIEYTLTFHTEGMSRAE